ncbi:HAD-IC family P-type ATPase [Homoserinimonas sp. OAct 916]|uniref:HAD-IC family P-type ATPase n=1 Tax=Homoserinimonas sp. OAct 916 TaxID=2211450 RepID=UPI001E293118|nr:HAD-IC family P-type ATPase [Homoserinimonas sp. OAct 916]
MNVLTLFNGIVLGGFLLLVLLGHWRDALFGFAAIANSIIGVSQEYRAKRLLDRLAILDSSNARVLRDGTVQHVAVEDVVQDDVLIVRAGDQVAADGVIIDDDGLEIDESLLTGESEPVDKSHGDEILSGSLVVGGQGRARVTRVGEASYSSRLTVEAKRFAMFNSEIRNSLNRLLGWITWALLPITAIVVNGQMQAYGGWEYALSSGAWRDAVVGVVASIIAMVPLGLVLISSVAFAVGGMKLAGMNVLVQELPALEGLARVDVLCIDKTGTLTDGAMIFDAVHDTAKVPPAGWRQVLGWFGDDPIANTTARCLATEFSASDGLEALSSVPFSSERKWSAVTFTDDCGSAGTWILGAPEFVLSPAAPHADQTLQKAAELAAAGLRTLILAHSPEQPSTGGDPSSPSLPDNRVPVTLLTFRERVRSDAAQTLAYFQKEGVEIRVLSGDDPLTVAAVAREVGLPVERGYDARTLPEDLDELSEVMANNVVFGRVTPYQKRDIVRALHARGHVVAMTGDGVNDALAMKEADIGIAMDSAAAATKAVSRLVLLDGRFDRLPVVVAEGRRVIANIERLAMLFLTKTAYIIVLSVVFGALLWEFPFLPRQLSATDGLTIGIPALFLALMPNTSRYVPGFLRRSLSFAVPAGATIAGALIAVGIYSRSGTGHGEGAQTSAVITLALIGLWVLIVLSRPLNLWRVLIIGSMYVGLVLLLVVPFVRDFFSVAWPPTDQLIASLIISFIACAGIEVMFRLNRTSRRRLLIANGPGHQNTEVPAQRPSRD